MVARADALTALVTSEARARLLTVVFSAPDRRWYQRELAREAALPLSAVQRELRRLVEAGFLSESREAGRRLFGPSPGSPVFQELQAIVVKLRGAVAVIRDVLQGERGVGLVWVFGSFAAGKASVLSDIDVMILGTVSAKTARSRLIPAERKLHRSINEHVMTPKEWRRRLDAQDGFLREVRQGPRLWIIGDDAGLADLDPIRKR